MIFSVIARDDSKEGTIAKRMSVRPTHVERMFAHKKSGHIVEAGAMINDNGDMIGSVMFVNFENYAEVEAFIKSDIYFEAGVWKSYEIIPLRLMPFPKD